MDRKLSNSMHLDIKQTCDTHGGSTDSLHKKIHILTAPIQTKKLHGESGKEVKMLGASTLKMWKAAI